MTPIPTLKPCQPRNAFALAGRQRRAGAHRKTGGARRRQADRAWRAEWARTDP